MKNKGPKGGKLYELVRHFSFLKEGKENLIFKFFQISLFWMYVGMHNHEAPVVREQLARVTSPKLRSSLGLTASAFIYQAILLAQDKKFFEVMAICNEKLS